MAAVQSILLFVFWLSVLLGLYTYFGYPLLLAALARLRRQPCYDENQLPVVTMIIAAFNEETVIAGKIEHALSLDYPADKFRVLVAADGSTDRTAEIVRSFTDPQVALSYSPERRGKLAATANAMARIPGGIVVITDANNRYSHDALRRLVAPFSDPQVGGVSGAKHIVRDASALGASEGLYWKYESFIKLQESRLSSCVAMPGEILAMRRELFVPPSGSVILDDVHHAMQILNQGYRIVYEPRAKSFEPISVTARDEFERRSRLTAGRYQALRLIPPALFYRRPIVMWQWLSHKLTRLLLPFAMLGALIANLLLVIWPPVFGTWPAWLTLAFPYGLLMLGLQGAFYFLAWLGGHTERRGRLGKILYVPSFLVASNFAALVGLYRHVTRRQTPMWRRVARPGEEPAA